MRAVVDPVIIGPPAQQPGTHIPMTLEEMASLAGKPLGTSDWFLLDQDRIDAFAGATDDHQFIHVNREAAERTSFGQTIAHGFLTTAMLSAMLSSLPKPEVKMSVNYGFNRLRFLAPVRSGRRVRGHFILVNLIEKRPGQWQQTVEVTIEIESEETPALRSEWVILHFT